MYKTVKRFAVKEIKSNIHVISDVLHNIVKEINKIEQLLVIVGLQSITNPACSHKMRTGDACDN